MVPQTTQRYVWAILGVMSNEKTAHLKVIPTSVRKHCIKLKEHANIKGPNNHPGGPAVAGSDEGSDIQDPKVSIIKTR